MNERVSLAAAAIAFAIFLLASCNSAERQSQPVVPVALTFDGAAATGRAAQLAHGERMSWMFGCRGCHGEDLAGMNVSEEDPEFGDMHAPNLTLLIRDYTDPELERVIRRGIPKDEREFWFMPSESFQYMSDADLSALSAYLRTLEPIGKQVPPLRKGPKFHEQVKQQLFTNARGMVDRFRKSQPVDLGPGHALGRHIAMIVCTECHNSELQGYEGFTPDLDIGGVYSKEELKTLLATGKGKAKPDLGLMSKAARSRFAKFTPRERDALVAYLKDRADRPQ